MTTRPRPRTPLVATLAAAALLASGCTSQETPEPAERTTADSYRAGIIGQQDGEAAPADGGTLRFGAYTEPRVLDPARTIAAGSTGGIEMAAIYDVLMRYDTESGTVRPQLAKSLTGNGRSTEWTLKLRPDVTFSDGTELDAAAVKWSLERYVAQGADEANLWAANVTEIATPDPHTVVFTLKSAWPDFSHMLTTGPGMIVAKSSERGAEFTPVGAGAFILAGHRPQESMELRARESYWGGAPHLARIRVSFLPDPHALMDSLRGGALDAVFLRDPKTVREAVEGDFGGFMNLVSLGDTAVINAASGRPGEDPRVRRAMAMAIDPGVISERAHDGAGLAAGELFPSFSRWHTDQRPLGHDPEAAKQLLKEAKAAGFDGKITYLDAQDPTSRATAIAVKAMLESVGFQVELDLVANVADQIRRVAVDRNYDVAGWGISWREAGPYGRIYATGHSHGNLSVGTRTGPEMDALIDELQGAEGTDAQRALMSRIQEQWNEDVPALVFGAIPEFLAWSDEVHGASGSANSIVLLDEAWVPDEEGR